MKFQALALFAALATGTALAAPGTYNIDPDHTHPEFEADHFNGLSVWRGVFKESKGTITLDKEAGTGTVNVEIATASIDFGHDKLNTHASSADMFDVAKYPTATYKGTLAKFASGAPTEVDGELTLHGVTKPVVLKINSFKCIMHPMLKREVCGADASTVINRADFGINYGEKFGFKMDVTLRIQVEAIKTE
jgi:polyisoprenoid-binding protein YceI